MTFTSSVHETRAHELAEKLVVFLETGEARPGLLAQDAFCDFSMPTWRLQAFGVDDVIALRRAGHPGPATVTRWRFDPTPTGFVLEFEEAWDAGGEHWTSREIVRADVNDAGISELSVYCTGDWDGASREAHAAAVSLIRP